jgi:hypothetical protein
MHNDVNGLMGQATTGNPRVIFVQTKFPPMNAEQLRLALGSMPDDDPRWRAVHQIIAGEMTSAMLDASDPNLDATKGTYPGGRVAALSELVAKLEEFRHAPLGQAAASVPSAKKRGR